MDNSGSLLRNDPGIALLNEYMSNEIQSIVTEQVTIMWRAVKEKMRPLKQKIRDTEEEINTFKKRVTEMEGLVSSLDEKLVKTEGTLANYRQEVGNLRTKVEELENIRNTETLDSTVGTEASGVSNYPDDDDEDDYYNDENPLKFLDDSLSYSDVETQMWGKSDTKEKKCNRKVNTKEDNPVKNMSRAKQPNHEGKKTRGRGRPAGSSNVGPSKAELAKRLQLNKQKLKKVLKIQKCDKN